MNIDRVAQVMTGGRPRAGFTARVMAPIDGRPSPGFTSRVMEGIDEPAGRSVAAGRSFNSGFGRALILIPAALAVAAGTFLLARGAVRMPDVPGAPTLATNAAGVPVPEAPPVAIRPAASHSVRAPHVAAVVSPTVPGPEPSPIYQIAALEGPAEIAVKDIQPAACTIPALDAPAPLTLKEIKEKS